MCDKGENAGNAARKTLRGQGLHEAYGPACERAADELFARQSDLESIWDVKNGRGANVCACGVCAVYMLGDDGEGDASGASWEMQVRNGRCATRWQYAWL